MLFWWWCAQRRIRRLVMSTLSCRVWYASAAGLVLFVVVGCTTFRGEYADPKSVEIVDESWNETDGRVVAEKVVQSMLSQPWLAQYQAKTKQRPIVVVGDVENRTDEHIDTQALVSYMADELINSGSVRFVDGEAREQILKEMRHQTESGEVAKGAAKQRGQQIGADFLLVGFVSSTVQVQKKLKLVTYQIQFRLTDLATSEIIWSNKELIKKRFRRGTLRL